MSDPQTHPVPKMPRSIGVTAPRQSDRLMRPKNYFAQRAARRQNSCMTSLVSRKCTQVVLQRSFRKCVYSSARQKKKRHLHVLLRLSFSDMAGCGAQSPSGAPRASSAKRHIRCLPLGRATTRIWHDNAPKSQVEGKFVGSTSL